MANNYSLKNLWRASGDGKVASDDDGTRYVVVERKGGLWVGRAVRATETHVEIAVWDGVLSWMTGMVEEIGEVMKFPYDHARMFLSKSAALDCAVEMLRRHMQQENWK